MKKLKFFINVLIDNDRKSLKTIIREIVVLRKKHRKNIDHYFTCLMYKKGAGNIHDYIPQNIYLNLMKNFFRSDGMHPILENKNKFSEYMLENNVPTACKIGFIIENQIRIENDKLIIKQEEDNCLKLHKALKEFNGLFVKQVNSLGGKGVYKISATDEINKILELIESNSEYIIEQEIKQHSYLNKINPYCINTLRVVTYNNGDDIKIASSLLRIGINKSHVDNASSGGAFVNYDIEKNRLDKTAYKFPKYSGKSYFKHPLTGFIFENQQLPYPNEIILLVQKAAKLFPDKQIVGWDVAYTPNGPLIIEGNDNPHMAMIQTSVKGLLSNKIYRDLLKDYRI